VTRQEFQTFIEGILNFPLKGRLIIPDEIWNELDYDGDGSLALEEFELASRRMSTGVLRVEPILIYPVKDIKYMYDFKSSSSSEVCTKILLLHRNSSTLPTNSTSWQNLYDSLEDGGIDILSRMRNVECRQMHQEPTVILAENNQTWVMPIAVSVPGQHSLTIDIDSEKRYAALTSTNIEQRVFGGNLDLRVHATKRFPDVVHVFDQNEDEDAQQQRYDRLFSNMTSIEATQVSVRHRNSVVKEFSDDTVVLVKGAVLFPRDWVDSSARCGLFEAIISVYETVNPNAEEKEYKTDETGWFEFAVTRGKSYMFSAKFPKHTICYTGRTIADAVDVIDCDGVETMVHLREVTDESYIFFTDATKGNIDLGLYQGECDALYTDALFSITPVNGCHAPVIVSSADINGWMTNMQNVPKDVYLPENARVWPFAAMDYSISLHEGSQVSGVPQLINSEPWKDGCANEGPGDMLHFFRRRNTLERLALMRDNSDWQSIRYKYHGFVCVEVVNIPIIADEDDVCYNSTEPAGALHAVHFLGSSQSSYVNVRQSRQVNVKVFELHRIGGDLVRCQKFPNTEDKTGSTKVQIRHDIGAESESPCHVRGKGGETCDFEVNLDEDGRLLVPQAEEVDPTSGITVAAGPPRLAGNHRRMLSVMVDRYDGYFATTVTGRREFVILGAKLRGGSGESDDQFWATVPINGLVYTVVHDPPGDNSYASLNTGTDIEISFTVSDQRAFSAGFKSTGELGTDLELKIDSQVSAGWIAEFGVDVEVAKAEAKLKFAQELEQPKFTVTGKKDDGWSLTTTTSRTITSSKDPAIPGRPGDVILGGGIELVYKLSDVLDLRDDIGLGVPDRPCLYTDVGISWLPRKPTSYLFNVHTIESQVVPNLRSLQVLVQSGAVENDDSGLVYDCVDAEHCTREEMKFGWQNELETRIESWVRTLAWSAPQVYLIPELGVDGQYAKDFSQLERIKTPYFGENSLYQRDFQTGETKYNDALDANSAGLATELANEWMRTSAIQLLDFGFLALGFPAIQLPYLNMARLVGFIENDVPGLSISYTKDDAVHAHFNDIFNTPSDDVLYQMGSNSAAAADLSSDIQRCGGSKCVSGELEGSNHSLYDGAVDSLGETRDLSATDASRIMASLTGSSAKTGMHVRGSPESAEESILLTFSGGGQTLDFTFTSKEGLGGESWNLGMSFDGSADNKFKFGVDIKNVFGYGIELAASQERQLSTERVFAWNKKGSVTASYSLADDDFGDKFVVSVGTDKRFGTPVFVTKGGRSLCPGEPLTMHRQSGVRIELDYEHRRHLNPDEQAVFRLKVVNESPYRERGQFGLRIRDGLDLAMKALHEAVFNEAARPSADGLSVSSVVNNTAAEWGQASLSSHIMRIKDEAAKKAGQGADALHVALAAAAAMQTAPPVGDELANSDFSVGFGSLDMSGTVSMLVEGDNLAGKQRVKETLLYLKVSPSSRGVIKHAQLELLSLCEADIESSLYRYPSNDRIALGEMTWESKCPSVAFDATTMARHAFTAVSQPEDAIPLTVFNPDASNLWPSSGSQEANANERLRFVRLQYRKVGAGEWITAKAEDSDEQNKKKNLLCDSSRLDGCTFEWELNNQYEKLMSGFKDGTYEVRVKNFCFGGPSLAISSVHEFVSDQRLTLSVDTVKPMEQMRISSDERFYGVKFYEPIDCSSTSVTVKKVNSQCGGTGAVQNVLVTPEQLQSYNINCFNGVDEGNWVIEFPYPAQGRYKVTVSGITDNAGNSAGVVYMYADVRCHLTTAALGEESELESPISPQQVHGRTPSSVALGAPVRKSAYATLRSMSSAPDLTFGVLTVISVIIGLIVKSKIRQQHTSASQSLNEHLVDAKKDELPDDEAAMLRSNVASLPSYGTSV
jgi:hypothetical protein